MLLPAQFHQLLLDRGVDFFAGVPDSLLKDYCAYLAESVEPRRHLIAANEGNAIGVAAGYHLATGRRACVYLQSSGLGNAVNPLTSLADAQVYALPMLLLIGHRGEPGVPDEPQHVKEGSSLFALLGALGIDAQLLPATVGEAAEVLDALPSDRPSALIVRRGTFGAHPGNSTATQPGLSRERAIELVAAAARPTDALVCTTGMAGRELFDLRERSGQDHASDFLNLGAMGHASSIALGLALAQPERRVLVIDGDGAALMHLGALAVIGARSPANLVHLVLNNGAHGSVGGQPTVARQIDLVGVARACGYPSAARVETEAELERALASPPAFLEVRIDLRHRKDLGRPTLSPGELKRRFVEFLRTGR